MISVSQMFLNMFFCVKVTAYGGELQYQLRFELQPRSVVIDGQPDVVLQGNGIFLEYYSQIKPLPKVHNTMTVSFREVFCLLFVKPSIFWLTYMSDTEHKFSIQ